jgi:hypothetical protein
MISLLKRASTTALSPHCACRNVSEGQQWGTQNVQPKRSRASGRRRQTRRYASSHGPARLQPARSLLVQRIRRVLNAANANQLPVSVLGQGGSAPGVCRLVSGGIVSACSTQAMTISWISRGRSRRSRAMV